jgi:predicted porin
VLNLTSLVANEGGDVFTVRDLSRANAIHVSFFRHLDRRTDGTDRGSFWNFAAEEDLKSATIFFSPFRAFFS